MKGRTLYEVEGLLCEGKDSCMKWKDFVCREGLCMKRRTLYEVEGLLDDCKDVALFDHI